jgi:hypothetical protein
MPRMYAYLYTIVCCDNDVAIYAGTVAECPGCHSRFEAKLELPEEAIHPSPAFVCAPAGMFDELLPTEAAELEIKLNHAHEEAIRLRDDFARMARRQRDNYRCCRYDRLSVRYSTLLCEQTQLMMDLRNRATV